MIKMSNICPDCGSHYLKRKNKRQIAETEGSFKDGRVIIHHEKAIGYWCRCGYDSNRSRKEPIQPKKKGLLDKLKFWRKK